MDGNQQNQDERIFRIVIPETLWAVKYPNETTDELSRLLRNGIT